MACTRCGRSAFTIAWNEDADLYGLCTECEKRYTSLFQATLCSFLLMCLTFLCVAGTAVYLAYCGLTGQL